MSELACSDCPLHIAGPSPKCALDDRPAYGPDSCHFEGLPGLVAELDAANARIAELEADIANAISQTREAVPDYPWPEVVTASIAAWAACSTVEGKGLALADLQAIVEKLPKTADGVPIVVGQNYYVHGGWAITALMTGTRIVHTTETINDRCDWSIGEVYSTRAAAEAAREKGEQP